MSQWKDENGNVVTDPKLIQQLEEQSAPSAADPTGALLGAQHEQVQQTRPGYLQRVGRRLSEASQSINDMPSNAANLVTGGGKGRVQAGLGLLSGFGAPANVLLSPVTAAGENALANGMGFSENTARLGGDILGLGAGLGIGALGAAGKLPAAYESAATLISGVKNSAPTNLIKNQTVDSLTKKFTQQYMSKIPDTLGEQIDTMGKEASSLYKQAEANTTKVGTKEIADALDRARSRASNPMAPNVNLRKELDTINVAGQQSYNRLVQLAQTLNSRANSWYGKDNETASTLAKLYRVVTNHLEGIDPVYKRANDLTAYESGAKDILGLIGKKNAGSAFRQMMLDKPEIAGKLNLTPDNINSMQSELNIIGGAPTDPYSKAKSVAKVTAILIAAAGGADGFARYGVHRAIYDYFGGK